MRPRQAHGWIIPSLLLSTTLLARPPGSRRADDMDVRGPAGCGRDRARRLQGQSALRLCGGVQWPPAPQRRRWNHLATGSVRRPGFLHSIAASPSNERVAYASSDRGLFKTWDGGKTWHQLHGGLPVGSTRAIGISVSDPRVVYVSERRAIFRSSDGGLTWRERSRGLPRNAGVRGLAVDPTNTQAAYAACHAGVFTTTNGGKRWAADRNVPDADWVAVSRSGRTVYAGTRSGVFIRRRVSNIWKRGDLSHTRVTSLATDLARERVVYAGTPRGVLKSTDRAAHWKGPAATLTDRHVSIVAIGGSSSGVYAATRI
jgi:photosystem II stability/assembly factor-like uncharacterized protein